MNKTTRKVLHTLITMIICSWNLGESYIRGELSSLKGLDDYELRLSRLGVFEYWTA